MRTVATLRAVTALRAVATLKAVTTWRAVATDDAFRAEEISVTLTPAWWYATRTCFNFLVLVVGLDFGFVRYVRQKWVVASPPRDATQLSK